MARKPTRSQMRTALRREALACWKRHFRARHGRIEFRLNWDNPDALISDENRGFTVGIGFDRHGGPRQLREMLAMLLDAQFPPDPVPAREPAETDLKEIPITGGPDGTGGE